MAENNKLTAAETEEYNEIVSSVKEEYKKKITLEIQNAKKEMAKEAISLLGQGFIDLLNERKRLLAEFGEKARAVLQFAINNKMTEDVNRLNDWSARLDKKSTLTGEGNKLFRQLVEKIEVFRPDITKSLKECEQNLITNNEKMTKMVAVKKDLLKTVENKYREKLKKIVVDLVVEFNKKIVVINQTFGIKDAKPLILESETNDLSISFEEKEEEDEIFIFSSNSDIIN